MSGLYARTGGIYVASKIKHAPKWRAYREAGFPIVSTWIDEAEEGQSSSYIDLWLRCVQEASNCACLIAYREQGEKLTGALIEIGCALAGPRLVLLTGHWDDFKQTSFTHHPIVQPVPNVNTAMSTGWRAADKFAAIARANARTPSSTQ